MNYDFTETEQLFVQQVASIMAAFSTGRHLERFDISDVQKNARDLIHALAQTPYTRYGADPAAVDLEGLHPIMAAMEEIAAVSPSLCLSVEMSLRVFGRLVSTWGTADQQATWLAGLADGSCIGAVGLSEQAMNIDNDPFQTRGVSDGDAVVVSGEKNYVINAPFADVIAVAGEMDGQSALFLIAGDTEGMQIGERIGIMGYEGAAIAGVKLADCRIPASSVIGPMDGKKMRGMLRLWENQIYLGLSLGVMKSAFESAKSYANEHHTGGKPIIAYQSVAFTLAEMLTLYQTAQLLAYRTAWTAQQAPKEAESLTWCAKAFCTESAEKVSSAALQVLGGSGLVSGNPAERGYRCAKFGQIAGTSSEIARVKIGDDALGYR